MGKTTRPHADEEKAPPRGEVRGLLRAWGDGDRGALDRQWQNRAHFSPSGKTPTLTSQS